MNRRLVRHRIGVAGLAVFLMTVSSCASASIHRATHHQFKGCDRAEVRLRISGQGTATQALINVEVSARRAPCALTGHVEFAVERQGEALHVRGNPTNTPLRGIAQRHRPRSVEYFWANWCGPRDHVRASARYNGQVADAGLPFLPDCIQRGRRSVLEVGP
jgi:hypothetical protein